MSEPRDHDGDPAAASAPSPSGQPPSGGGETGGIARQVEEPAKVMRIGTMIKQLLDEVRAAPLDEAARDRLVTVHEASLRELRDGLSPELSDELERITLPFSGDATPSDAELRIAQAQLVGWLEGLFHGIQTAIMAQQVQARAQLSHLRQLPPGVTIAPTGEGTPTPLVDDRRAPGQYL